jgi:hypothetical protein
MSFNLSDDLLKLVSSQKQRNVICERVQLMAVAQKAKIGFIS